MTSPLLKDLNKRQVEAVQATEGPLLIIAGAGSGKTRALTNRVAYLIQEKAVAPWNILAVTFTNKAASEMKQRITRLLSKPLLSESQNVGECTAGGISENKANLRQASSHQAQDLPTVGTFHAICAQILRKHIHMLGYENQFVIYDTNDQVVLMRELMRDYGISDKQVNPKAVLGHISQAKSQLITWQEYQTRAHGPFAEKVAQLYKPYQARLAKNQALDFDDLLMKTVQLFQQQPDLLTYYQEKWRYISVDEYQDTNHAQYTIVKLLAEKYRNICVIGDPDQSIYSWRGANMQNILDFEKDYPEALIIKLEQNYRSTSVILDAAHQIIQRNRNRKEKQLWTNREGGEKIRIWTARDERDESFKVAQTIQEHARREEAPDYKNFAVLYRTNAQSRNLEEAFMRYGLPYKIVGNVKFYLRKEIKDIIAYLRATHNPDDDVSLLRIINTPARKIGQKTVATLQNFATHHDISIFRALQRVNEIPSLSSKTPILDKFTSMIHHFQKLNQEFAAAGVMKHIITESGYKDFLLADKSPEGEARFQNVQELTSVANKYEPLEAGISLSTFLEEIALITDLDSLDQEQNAITLMTLHSAKGLEFPIVFITGLEEGIFPHSRSLFEPQELEEERRLMYVGVTRAMDKLYLLHARQRMLFGEFKQNSPSQFLLDIPEELMEGYIDGSIEERRDHPVFGESQKNRTQRSFGTRPIPAEGDLNTDTFQADENPSLTDGDRVLHKTFGEGVVINVTGGIVTIAFKNKKYGIKKLALSIAPLKKV
jgi:DNA helicase II / ATP-dependent DNA helicase PcrA